jgi:hypothetical protein
VNQQMLRTGIVALLMVAWCAAAGAQAPGPPPEGNVVFFHSTGGPVDGMFAYEGLIGNFDGKNVIGAPFSAQVTTEHVQMLADGNTIDNKTSGTIARDSSGRTRREMSLPAIGPLTTSGQAPQMVFISDPVAKSNLALNLTEKTAHQLPLPPRDKFLQKELRNSPPGLPKEEFLSGNTESLGQKSVEGITVQGTRVTRTIPAGAMGNANPIVITTERWQSPDLQIMVLETRSDPRFGTTTFQLTNISRNEPDPSLFTVPSDFTLQQGKGLFHGEIGVTTRPPMPPQD